MVIYIIKHLIFKPDPDRNMVISGKADTNNDLNRFSIVQGRSMMTNARAVLLDLLSGKTLKKMENGTLQPDGEKMFKSTKAQLIRSIDIVNLLIQMEYE